MGAPGQAGGSFNPASPAGILAPVRLLPTNGPLLVGAGIVLITKTTAALPILAQPNVGQDGMEMTITSATAAAHVVTGSFQDGVTGGAKTTATFAAFAGATMTLIAVNKQWNVKALNAVTIT